MRIKSNPTTDITVTVNYELYITDYIRNSVHLGLNINIRWRLKALPDADYAYKGAQLRVSIALEMFAPS